MVANLNLNAVQCVLNGHTDIDWPKDIYDAGNRQIHEVKKTETHWNKSAILNLASVHIWVINMHDRGLWHFRPFVVPLMSGDLSPINRNFIDIYLLHDTSSHALHYYRNIKYKGRIFSALAALKLVHIAVVERETYWLQNFRGISRILKLVLLS
jgi:hypothetical protein